MIILIDWVLLVLELMAYYAAAWVAVWLLYRVIVWLDVPHVVQRAWRRLKWTR